MFVKFGQHEKQDAIDAGADFGLIAMGHGDPVIDQARQIEGFHIAVGHAEQHRGDFLIFHITIKEIGDLSAQKEL